MAFRWKTQQPVAPQMALGGGQAAYDASQAAQMANGAPQGAPVAAEAFPDINAQIREKEARLASVEARIAEIDRQYPELKNGGQEWEIAAKRAELGDMSAYDSMMARGQQAGVQAGAIETELKNAEKLLWGLESKNDEDRAMARNQIEVALRSAEEWQDRTGQQLPASYDRLRSALERGPSGQNANELVNYYKYKMSKGELTDADREYVDTVLRPKMNSEDFDRLFAFLNESKGKTVEAKEAAMAYARKISDMVSGIEGKSPSEQNAWWNGLTKKERAAVLKIATWKTGPNGEYLERKK